MSIPTKRACDACHRRKVRCNSQQPCGNCSQAGLSCTYEAIPQKKGPKGSRAKVISELRETQKQSDILQHRQQQQENHHQINGTHVYSSPPRSPVYTPTPGILTRQLIESCTDFYFFHMYPLMPILHREQLQQIIIESESSPKSYCLVTTLCAFMLIQPGIVLNSSPTVERPLDSVTNPQMGQVLMNEASRLQKSLDYVENPTENSIITSFFLFGCAFGLSKHNTAWNHLREATAQAHNLGLSDESTYIYGDRPGSMRKRRLFWLLFVTERAYALQKHLPLTLHATIALPTDTDTQNSASLSGFIHLINLYRPFDDTFIGLWNKSRSDCSTLWLAQLQQQLTQALPAYLNTTEPQATDLRCSQQWLRAVVWQLSIANGFLSSASQDGCMTFTYPIEIAKDLVDVMSGFSTQSMDVHGIGLIEKIFDVACTLIDVMSCVPPSPAQHPSTSPQTYLNQLLTLISTLRGGESRYLPLVMAKIRATLPAIIPALPQHLVMKAALHQRGPSLGGHVSSGRNSLGISDGGGGSINVGAVAGAVAGPGATLIKRESGSSSTSGASSPYEAPSFLHYYPLA